MTKKDFVDLVSKQEAVEQRILVGKGEEYSEGNDDMLNNFKDVAHRVGIAPLSVWLVYLSKHLSSIYNFVHTGKTPSGEGIHGRITDARNYLLLGLALLEEQGITSVLEERAE